MNNTNYANFIDNKINKYIYKIFNVCNMSDKLVKLNTSDTTSYICKLSKLLFKSFVYHQFKSDQNMQNGGFVKYSKSTNILNIHDINQSELISYVQSKLNISKLNKLKLDKSKSNNLKNKYFVLLMGAPGTGKTIARKLAICTLLKNFEQISIEDIQKNEYKNIILNSFVDISLDIFIDEFVDQSTNLTGKELLIKQSKDLIINEFVKLKSTNFDSGKFNLTDSYSDDIYNFVKSNIKLQKKLAKTTYKTYYMIRKHVQNISMIILYIATYLELNIFFETTGADLKYLLMLISEYYTYNYIPIIVNSYISDENIHKERLIKRALQNGRFINWNLHVMPKNKLASKNFDYLKHKYMSKTNVKNIGFIKFDNGPNILNNLNICDMNSEYIQNTIKKY